MFFLDKLHMTITSSGELKGFNTLKRFPPLRSRAKGAFQVLILYWHFDIEAYSVDKGRTQEP